MKLRIVILFVFAFSLQSKAQDYISYFNLCNKAEKQIYLEQYDSALFSFRTAFLKVDYVHANYCKKASICAAIQNDFDLAYYFAFKALKKGISVDYLSDPVFKMFKQQYEYELLIKNVAYYQKCYEESLNQEYISLIDSLFYVDQCLIYGNSETLAVKYDMSSLNTQDKEVLDSLNFHFLLGLISKYGFPSERIVDRPSLLKANTILHHNLRKTKNKQHLNNFEKYLHTGEYLPADFGVTFDQSFYYKGKSKPKIYFYAPGFDNYLSIEKIKRIDSIRYSYGIKPMDAFTRSKIGDHPKW